MSTFRNITLGSASMVLALGFAFAAAPVSLDLAKGGIMKSASAFAKNGADDGAGHGGGHGGKGGKGRGGHDDGPNHK